jgi:hypothetical protein
MGRRSVLSACGLSGAVYPRSDLLYGRQCAYVFAEPPAKLISYYTNVRSTIATGISPSLITLSYLLRFIFVTSCFPSRFLIRTCSTQPLSDALTAPLNLQTLWRCTTLFYSLTYLLTYLVGGQLGAEGNLPISPHERCLTKSRSCVQLRRACHY